MNEYKTQTCKNEIPPSKCLLRSGLREDWAICSSPTILRWDSGGMFGRCRCLVAAEQLWDRICWLVNKNLDLKTAG